MDSSIKKKIFKGSIVILICCIIAELSIFNFRHWLSLGYQETDITSYFSAKNGLREISYEDAKKKSAVELDNDKARYFEVANPKVNAYIEALGVNKSIKNIYIDIFNVKTMNEEPENDSFDLVTFNVYYTDKGNHQYNYLGSRLSVVDGIEKSRYKTSTSVGMTEKLEIKLEPNTNDNWKQNEYRFKDKVIGINKISINKPVPLDFNFIRLSIVFVIVWVIRFIFVDKHSEVLEYKLNKSSKKQRYATFVVGFLLILFSSNFFMNARDVDPRDYINTMYYKLCDSILRGKVSQTTVPQYWLSRLDNVYDANNRQHYMTPDATETNGTQAQFTNGSPVKQAYNNGFRWRLAHFGGVAIDKYVNNYQFDNVYYNGKYYIYFGLAPLYLILPYRLITGLDLDLRVYSFIMTCFLCFAAFKFMRIALSKFCKSISYIGYILAASILFLSSECLISRQVLIYHLLLYNSVSFALIGMSFFLSCYDEEKKKVSCIKIALGSLFMALIVTARPHVILSVITIVPLLWQLTFKERALFSRKSIGATIGLILPVLMVAAVQMAYNYIRFGSVLEFGANYQLTVNDVLNRRTGLSSFCYDMFLMLFSGIQTSFEFPFIQAQSFTAIWKMAMGTNDMGPVQFGGVFAKYIIMWFIPLIFAVKKQLKDNRSWGFTLCCTISGFAIAAAVIFKIGYWQRYVCDFVFLLIIASVLIGDSLIAKWKDNIIGYKVRKYVFGMMFITLVSCLLLYFVTVPEECMVSGNSVDLLGTDILNPKFFYKVYYALMFMV